ncbi:Polyhedral organelle shell protein PduT [Moorella glycerini]|uniref:BMC domain protein n=1 Tax=Neomoorella stamsii TaxID=1266720 RepID=A0A9X7P4T4_9FIRM|nr:MULTISPECIES: BMC domain-containing protein [Moorella]PRR68624.1 BMC domain protein [Moorella stamsii]CEP66533.1 Polyhedral organelle shell protein PduT [Moorella glycerini]
MGIAVGLIELKSLARGLMVADSCLKAAPVDLKIRTTCPGKSLIILTGEISAVTSAVEHGVATGGVTVVNSLILGNLHPGVLPALSGVATATPKSAMGVLETFSVTAAIKAADTAAKAAIVELLDIRPAYGLGGKGVVILTGSVGAVQAAVNAATPPLKEEGELVDAVVIPSPHPELWEQLG